MIAWYIVQYETIEEVGFKYRRVAMCRFREIDNQWSESEVLGDRAIVKVNAPENVLNELDKVFFRLPKDDLGSSLYGLTPAERKKLKDELLDMGYSDSEIRAELGDNLSKKTLKEYLDFATTRRLKPRYDKTSNSIVLDGPIQACKSIEMLDREIK